MLSDIDTGFNKISNNNNYFAYCSVTASHNNHRTLNNINIFTKTFRLLLYKSFHVIVKNVFIGTQNIRVSSILNNSKDYRLFLRGEPLKIKRMQRKDSIISQITCCTVLD